MPHPETASIWKEIVRVIEEKLQYGLFEQIKSVVNVSIDGDELTLTVASDEAYNFFQSEVNQQRLIIISRAVISLEKVFVKKADAAPLPID